MLDASASEPDHLYGAIEVGGTIRSTDGGEHWENLSHGQYVNDDMVDMHGVLASRWRPGNVYGIGTRRHVAQRRRRRSLEPRAARAAEHEGADLLPRHPRGAGQPAPSLGRGRSGFITTSASCCTAATAATAGRRSMSARRCRIRCSSWRSTERQPSRMSCATNGGEVWTSHDSGESWTPQPPPPDGTQVYALARG